MKNGKDTQDPLAQTREAIAELEGAAWEEEEPTGETHVHVAPGGQVVVGQTGRFRAVELPTQPDNEAPSETPKAAKGIVAILKVVDRPSRVAALAILAALIAFAIWRGAVGILG